MELAFDISRTAHTPVDPAGRRTVVAEKRSEFQSKLTNETGARR